MSSSTQIPADRPSKILQMFNELAPILAGQKEFREVKCYQQKKLLELHAEHLRGILIDLVSISMDSNTYTQRQSEAYAKLSEIKNTLREFETLLIGISDGLHDIMDFINVQLRRIVKSIILLKYFQSGTVESREEISNLLGIPLNPYGPTNASGSSGSVMFCKIYLELNTYLLGLLDIGDELYAYALVGVGLGYYDRPQAVFSFLNEIVRGFTLIEQTEPIRKKLWYYEQDVLTKIRKILFELKIRNATEIESEIEARFQGSSSSPDNKQEFVLKFPTQTEPVAEAEEGAGGGALE